MNNKEKRGKMLLMAFSLMLMAPMLAMLILPASSTSATAAGGDDGKYQMTIKEGFWGEFCPVGEPCRVLNYRENVITNKGLNHLAIMMGWGQASPVNYLAVGNGTAPALASTTLDGEQTAYGLARAQGTAYNISVGNWEVNYTFTYTGANTLKVNTTGNFNASSAGTMYAGGTIADVTFATNGDQLKLRHNFTVTEG